MVFFITVTLLLLNMINGVIVTSFSAIREESENNIDDKENKCFICSIDKSVFEKKNIDFYEHSFKDHNLESYIYYIISLREKNLKDLDISERSIRYRIDNHNVNIFPISQYLFNGTNITDYSNNEENDD